MKPRVRLAVTHTPDGGEMVLWQHDRDFLITVNGLELMSSRQHESELELARLGCAHLAGHPAPCVLIGGLGMGYSLRAALDKLGPEARVVVGELVPDVIDWNRRFLGVLNNNPLEDTRVELATGDIVELISQSRHRFNAILLDVDNGPSAMTHAGNQRLYSPAGIHACRRALRPKGCLAVWSAESSKPFERRLMSAGFHVSRFRVPAYKGSKSACRFVWVASEDKTVIPPGGGEPLPQTPTPAKRPRPRGRRSGRTYRS